MRETVLGHFASCEATVRETYNAVLKAARRLGPVREEPKKTSIHLVRETAFAGVSTRRKWLVLTLKSAVDVDGPRVGKREQISAHRWHIEMRLGSTRDVDREMERWIKAAYDLSG
jgi:Domain of unknown function (DUF5655)